MKVISENRGAAWNAVATCVCVAILTGVVWIWTGATHGEMLLALSALAASAPAVVSAYYVQGFFGTLKYVGATACGIGVVYAMLACASAAPVPLFFLLGAAVAWAVGGSAALVARVVFARHRAFVDDRH